MDLKFSFGGASPDHHHGDDGGAPSGIPLPFTTVAPGSTSTVLDASVRRDGALVIGEIITGDGVTYARAEVETAADADGAMIGKAVRSALARAVATLEGPLAESVTAVVIDLGPTGADALASLGIDTEQPVVTDQLQSRIGIATGTPIRLAA
ncbi:hypothetical protein [Leucobacter japonicus]|uniref:hypothetical protein n=1 Tax=Leucobacter japonicus TaxID=1461259 RepID=UPI0006A7E467|nr:hypothetical protein [Leucobacter japonicus]